MMGMELKFEGRIPLVFNEKQAPDGMHPWAVFIKQTNLKSLKNSYPYRLSLEKTRNFSSFKEEFSKLNILLAPDPYQPFLIKLRNVDKSRLRIFSGSVQIDGKYYTFYEETVRKRISLKMKGGVYEHANPVIYFNIQ